MFIDTWYILFHGHLLLLTDICVQCFQFYDTHYRAKFLHFICADLSQQSWNFVYNLFVILQYIGLSVLCNASKFYIKYLSLFSFTISIYTVMTQLWSEDQIRHNLLQHIRHHGFCFIYVTLAYIFTIRKTQATIACNLNNIHVGERGFFDDLNKLLRTVSFCVPK